MENAGRAPVPLFSSDLTPTAATAVTDDSISVKQPASAAAAISAVDYTPLPWIGYFDNQHDVTIPDTHDTFRLYTAGQHGQSQITAHRAARWPVRCVVCASL